MASKRNQVRRKKSSSLPRCRSSQSVRSKSRLPKTVLVQGIKIPVVLSECPDKDALGMFVNFPTPAIYINPEQPEAEQRSTLFHEVLEAIGVVYGLELPEHVICTFELALRALFKDNPRLQLFGTKI